MFIRAFNIPITSIPNKLKNPTMPVNSSETKAKALFHCLRKNTQTIKTRGKANLFSEYGGIELSVLALTMVIKAVYRKTLNASPKTSPVPYLISFAGTLRPYLTVKTSKNSGSNNRALTRRRSGDGALYDFRFIAT